MDDERTFIGQRRIVPRPQPNLEVGERTVPAKYLNDKSKGETGDVEDLDSFVLNPPKCTKEKKDDPEKMDYHDTVCKDLGEHLQTGLSL